MSVISKLLSAGLRNNGKSLFTKTKVFRNFSSSSSNNPNILDSGFPDVEIPNVPIQEYVFSKLEKFEKFVAIECGVTGRKYTYGDLLVKARNFGKSLRKKLELKEKDVVGILLPNVPEFPIAVLGILDAGLVATTLNPIYTPEEISRQLTDSSTKALITLCEFWNVAKASTNLINKSLPILVIKTEQAQSLPAGAIDFKEFVDNPVDFLITKSVHFDDVALLPYSSGTTGLPKGVQLSHRNIVSNMAQNLSPALSVIEETSENHQDVVPAVLPMFHIYGLTFTSMISLCTGCKGVTLPKFTPELYVSTLRDYKPDLLILVPPIVLFLTLHQSVKPEYLQSLRAVFSGAAPLGAQDEVRFVEKAGKPIHMLQGYGLTETSPTVSAISVQLKTEINVAGSIGRPVPNTLVKVVNIDDPTGTPLGPNTPGELLVKGPQVMKGYLNKPEETKQTFLDGWLRTGDMVYYNDDRILFVTDRLKELIKVKGFQVPPAELEEIIRGFPNVADAAVIGVPHAIYGEAPRAYVVPKNNAKVDVEELEKHVASKVAKYKRLVGGVAVVDSIPKNASGKILRRNLKSQYEQEEGLVK